MIKIKPYSILRENSRIIKTLAKMLEEEDGVTDDDSCISVLTGLTYIPASIPTTRLVAKPWRHKGKQI
jgi:hypothetical protein